MNLKEEYRLLVKTIKAKRKEEGKTHKNIDIAPLLGYNSDYFATLTGNSGKVTEEHILKLKEVFKNELIEKPAPAGDKLNRERAIIKVLLHEVARLKAKDEGISFEKALEAIKRSTNLVLDDLDDL
ncbi:hypothetical protein [Chitinophaga sp.]|uniref:hypothetical protein n=1 Tax=Chitinophaga sp. TaxID=1869181 RepID=UPI0031DB846B